MANTRSRIAEKLKLQQQRRGTDLLIDPQEEKKSIYIKKERIVQDPTIADDAMHVVSETGAGVPAFLAKLWRLVEDPNTDNLICWSKDGRSFIIQNQAQFARELLPLNYKHNNMASFIRQLNMYGFHKVTSIDNGGLRFDRDEMEFSHPCFKRDCAYLLEHIKRKIANTKMIDDKTSSKPEIVTKVLQDVKAMRGRQDSLDSRFSSMKQENEALWREIASLRQKHAKQQQIVNKLIQFLITIVQPTHNMTSVRRNMQLMIHDKPGSGKFHTDSETESEGPVIHELGEELLEEVADAEARMMDPSSPYAKVLHGRENDCSSPLSIERPLSRISQLSHLECSNQSADDAAVGPSTSGKRLPSMSDKLGFVGGGAAATGANVESTIIKSINSDGTPIFYHVTEVPDAVELYAMKSPNYNEDNVLTTPLVRKQMARSKQLKKKNKERRKKAEAEESAAAVVVSINKTQQRGQSSPPIKVKAERRDSPLDPRTILSVYPEEPMLTPTHDLITSPRSEHSQSPNSNVNSLASNKSIGGVDTTASPATTMFYDSEFLTDDIATNMFEASLFDDLNNCNQQQQQQLQQEQQEQQQFGLPSANGGKYSAYLAGNNNGMTSVGNTNGASTSAAAAAAVAAAPNNINNQFGIGGGKQSIAMQNNALISTGKNMAVTKYNKNGQEGGTRLSIPEELNNHLDSVQDELDSLKDLLRSDTGCSLDASALLSREDSSSSILNQISLLQQLDGDLYNKLFNDTDLLDPYGLNMNNDNSTDKKGSELMTYQPMFDFCDIMDINNPENLEALNSPANNASDSQNLGAPPSSLNTPCHE